jgi:hypothetical protein
MPRLAPGESRAFFFSAHFVSAHFVSKGWNRAAGSFF